MRKRQLFRLVIGLPKTLSGRKKALYGGMRAGMWETWKMIMTVRRVISPLRFRIPGGHVALISFSINPVPLLPPIQHASPIASTIPRDTSRTRGPLSHPVYLPVFREILALRHSYPPRVRLKFPCTVRNFPPPLFSV